jgi:hypothetical protein
MMQTFKSRFVFPEMKGARKLMKSEERISIQLETDLSGALACLTELVVGIDPEYRERP